MVCRDFILPEDCKLCLFLFTFQFAKLIVPYRGTMRNGSNGNEAYPSVTLYCSPGGTLY